MRVLLIPGSFLVALAVKYSIYTLWGAFAFAFGIQPILESSGNFGAVLWSGAVAVLSTALVVCILRQYATEDQRTLRKWGNAEAIITAAWLVNTAFYPAALIASWVLDTLSAPHVILIALGYLVIPAWRLIYLIGRASPRVA